MWQGEIVYLRGYGLADLEHGAAQAVLARIHPGEVPALDRGEDGVGELTLARLKVEDFLFDRASGRAI